MGRKDKTPSPPPFCSSSVLFNPEKKRKKAKKAKLHTVFNFKFTLTNTWNF